MSGQDNSPWGGAPPPIDPRLQPFQVDSCDVNEMRDATRLVNTDPAIRDLLKNLGITHSEIDYANDHNVDAAGHVGASNREWAATLIGAAQLTLQQGKTLNQLNEAEIIAAGRRIYEKFVEREGAVAAGTVAADVCEVGAGLPENLSLTDNTAHIVPRR